MNELEEQLQNYLINKSAELLNIESDKIEWDLDLDEYGFDSMNVNKLCLEINNEFGIEVRPAIFLEYTSLEEFSDYLKKNFYAQVEEVVLD